MVTAPPMAAGGGTGAGVAPMEVEIPNVAAAVAAPPAMPVLASGSVATNEALLLMAQSIQALAQVGKSNGGGVAARTPMRVSVPHLPAWDGKTPGRKAETFLNDVAWYAEQGGQDALQLLPRVLAPGPRTSWDALCARYSDKGTAMTWQDARREFKTMVGESQEHEEDEATRAFLEKGVKMTEGQTVAAYRTIFDDKLRLTPAITEKLAVFYFVRGLLPKLAKHCQGDATGQMFRTLDAAFQYAVMAERIERTSGTNTTSAVAAVAVPAKQNAGGGRGGHMGGRGRGGGRWGRGGFHGGRGGYGNVNKSGNNFYQGAGRGGGHGGRSGAGGRGGGWRQEPDGSFTPQCNKCLQWGHKVFECPLWNVGGGGGRGAGRGAYGGGGHGRGGGASGAAAGVVNT
jgi:hypothetical protein